MENLEHILRRNLQNKECLNRMMKNLIKTAIFLIIVVAMVLALQYCFVPFFGKDTNQSRSYYEIPENSIDVLVVGGSMTRVSMSPLLIYENTGIATYNRGSARQLPEISYLNVKEALKKHDLKLVISNTSTLVNKTGADRDEPFIRRGMDYRKLSLDKILISAKFVRDSEWQSLGTYILPILRYHSNWASIEKTYRAKKEKEAYDYMHGQYPVYKHLYLENQVLKEDNKQFKLVDRAVEYQTKIAKLCKENNCELLLLEMPDSRWTTAKHKAVQEFADKLGVKFIDFNTDNLMERCNISWQTDFYEGHHLNVRGSVKATKYISGILTDYYGLKPSKLSTEIQEQFKQDIELFRKDMKTIRYKEVKQ